MVPIPLLILEEHHEAFVAWHHAIQQGWIPEKGNTLLHVDTHSDFATPPLTTALPALATRLDEIDAFANSELDIGSFIVPAVAQGMFRRVLWLYPRGPNGERRSADSYMCVRFAGPQRPLLQTSYRREVDWTEFFRQDCRHAKVAQFTLDDGVELRGDGPFVLDIDLDYFSCNEVPVTPEFQIEISAQQFESLRRDRYHPMRILGGRQFHPKASDGRFFLVANAGSSRPSRLRVSELDIRQRIELFVDFLRREQIVPGIIDVCRSRISGFTPDDQCEMIESCLLSKLRELYGLEVAHIKELIDRTPK
jgi:hypothetical protein